MTLGNALALSANAHSEQTDLAGKPYFLHCLRVMKGLRTSDEELLIIAVLHDVVEDTHWTIEGLEELGYSKRVTVAVALLTHKKKISEEEYAEYLELIALNKDATLVKMADLRDNSDINRLKGITDRDIKRTIKYQKSYTFLKENLNKMNLL